MRRDRERNTVWVSETTARTRETEEEFRNRYEYTTGLTVHYNGAYDPIDFTVVKGRALVCMVELKSAKTYYEKAFALKLSKYKDILMYTIFLKIDVFIYWRIHDEPPGWYYQYKPIEKGKILPLEYGWAEALNTANSNPIVYVPTERLTHEFFGAMKND
jgi:hypothetical protein